MAFHCDYLRITVFADALEVRQLVSEGLAEPAGLPGDWIDRGAAGRWVHIWDLNAMVQVLEPKPGKGRQWCCVELKGEGSTWCGDERLQSFLVYLVACGKEWRGKRFDACWDHVAIGPVELYTILKRGDLRSRVFRAEGAELKQNVEGDTCYLRKRRGENDRLVRVYNRRGFNRLELQLQGASAMCVLEELYGRPVREWAGVCARQLSWYMQLVDARANVRIERCPVLPVWEAFIADATKEALPPSAAAEASPAPEPKRARTALGDAEAFIQRNARKLRALGDAYGWTWLRDRVMMYAEKTWGPDDEALVEQLGRFAWSGLAGLPGDAEDPPF